MIRSKHVSWDSYHMSFSDLGVWLSYCEYSVLVVCVYVYAVCINDALCVCFHCRRVQQCSQSASPALPLSVVKERHLAVAVTLWTHFLPFLRTLRISQSPPEELAHAAAGQTSVTYSNVIFIMKDAVILSMWCKASCLLNVLIVQWASCVLLRAGSITILHTIYREHGGRYSCRCDRCQMCTIFFFLIINHVVSLSRSSRLYFVSDGFA